MEPSALPMSMIKPTIILRRKDKVKLFIKKIRSKLS